MDELFVVCIATVSGGVAGAIVNILKVLKAHKQSELLVLNMQFSKNVTKRKMLNSDVSIDSVVTEEFELLPFISGE